MCSERASGYRDTVSTSSRSRRCALALSPRARKIWMRSSQKPGAVSTPPRCSQCAARRPVYGADKIAMRKKRYGIWQEYSWADSLAHVRDFALGLISLGLQPGDRVCIIGDNDPELTMARLVENQFNDFGLTHEWHLYTGAHTEEYWSAHVEEYLRWYVEAWNKN